MTGAQSLGPCVVFVDADNTLWDTNGIYAEAQLALLDELRNARSSGCQQRIGSPG